MRPTVAPAEQPSHRLDGLAPAFLAMALLGATLAPNGLAHGDSGAHNDLVNLTPGPSGWRGPEGSGSTTPAGWYAGSASGWAQANSFAPTVLRANSLPGCPAPTSDAEIDARLCDAITVDPNLTLPFIQTLCDFEVGGHGNYPTDGQDEHIIDGTELTYVADPPITLLPYLPDGTFNDGGIGAVCHTPAGFYPWGPFNTPGCPAGNAHAEDVVHGGNVWVMTGCDSIRPVSTSPLLLQALSLEVCAVSVLGSTYNNRYVECFNRFRDCSLGPVVPELAYGCPPLPSATACVPDGIPDNFNTGFGGANSGTISSVHAELTDRHQWWLGVPYPAVSAACAGLGTDSAQVAYVWNAVIATVSVSGVALNSVSTPVYGWVN